MWKIDIYQLVNLPDLLLNNNWLKSDCLCYLNLIESHMGRIIFVKTEHHE